MAESIREFVDSGDQRLRVDRQRGVLRGVKLLGIESQNGRRYREHALRQAARLYEGSKVNVNHPKGSPLAPRDYQDRLGVIRGVEFRAGQGLFADLHFNPKHTLSEQLVWDAEHQPANVGLSHNVLARTTREGDLTTVEAITRVQSVDLVADPASTRGLFEESEPAEPPVPRPTSPHDGPPLDLRWDALTAEHLQLHRPDLVEELQQGIRAQLDTVSAREAASRRRQRVAELLLEHSLPLPGSDDQQAGQIVSRRFLDALMKAPDEETLRLLVEERAALVQSAQRLAPGRSTTPTCRDQLAVPAGAAVDSTDEFVRAVRS